MQTVRVYQSLSPLHTWEAGPTKTPILHNFIIDEPATYFWPLRVLLSGNGIHICPSQAINHSLNRMAIVCALILF